MYDGFTTEGSIFTRGDELRTGGPHGRNESTNVCSTIEGSMFTRGDEATRIRGPYRRYCGC